MMVSLKPSSSQNILKQSQNIPKIQLGGSKILENDDFSETVVFSIFWEHNLIFWVTIDILGECTQNIKKMMVSVKPSSFDNRLFQLKKGDPFYSPVYLLGGFKVP